MYYMFWRSCLVWVCFVLHCREEYSIANAVFQILCGAVSPMDILTAHTTEGKKYFSLLVNWGMIADIDIESEKYRRLGETRFLIGAVSCIFKKRIYRGKVSYLPKDTNTDDLGPTPGSSSTAQTAEQQNHCNESTSEAVPMEQSSGNTEGTGHSVQPPQSAGTSTNGPPTPLINSLTDPVPSNWVVMESDYMNINVSSVSHMAHDVFAINQAFVGCGTIYIIYVEASITGRMDLLKMIDRMAKGNHTEMSMVRVVEAKAFRIEPADDGPTGVITLDGEEIPYGPLQGQIHPQMGRVLGRRTKPQ